MKLKIEFELDVDMDKIEKYHGRNVRDNFVNKCDNGKLKEQMLEILRDDFEDMYATIKRLNVYRYINGKSEGTE